LPIPGGRGQFHTGINEKEFAMDTTTGLTLALATHESRKDGYVLRFQSLFDEGRAFAFPCDAQGHVDLDALSERARNNYLYARAVIGREVAMPEVEPVLH
jgi:hypothetical protein